MKIQRQREQFSYRIAMPTLYRGLKGVRFPGALRVKIEDGHLDAGNLIVDHLLSADSPSKPYEHGEGMGIHWTPNPNVAYLFGGHYTNSEPHGVVLVGEWGGKGRRRIPKQNVIPEEEETQLHPGTPLTVTKVLVSLNGGDWQEFPASREVMA